MSDSRKELSPTEHYKFMLLGWAHEVSGKEPTEIEFPHDFYTELKAFPPIVLIKLFKDLDKLKPDARAHFQVLANALKLLEIAQLFDEIVDYGLNKLDKKTNDSEEPESQDVRSANLAERNSILEKLQQQSIAVIIDLHLNLQRQIHPNKDFPHITHQLFSAVFEMIDSQAENNESLIFEFLDALNMFPDKEMFISNLFPECNKVLEKYMQEIYNTFSFYRSVTSSISEAVHYVKDVTEGKSTTNIKGLNIPGLKKRQSELLEQLKKLDPRLANYYLNQLSASIEFHQREAEIQTGHKDQLIKILNT